MKKTLAAIIIVFVFVGLIAVTPASAQIAPLFGGTQSKTTTVTPTTITIWGSVTDEWGNPLAGLGWPGVKMVLYQEFSLGKGKTSWQVVAETACDRYGSGNGCPDQYNGYYQFSHTLWGGDLYSGRYQIEVSAKGFGATRSKTFYVKGYGGSQDFTLIQLQAYVWANPERSEIIGDKVTLTLSTYGSEYEELSVLFDIEAVAQSVTNDSEKKLDLSPKTVIRSVVLARSLQSTWKVSRTFPELAEVAPGTRVCFSVTLRYDGYEDWVAGKTNEPVCMVKNMQQGFVMVPVR